MFKLSPFNPLFVSIFYLPLTPSFSDGSVDLGTVREEPPGALVEDKSSESWEAVPSAWSTHWGTAEGHHMDNTWLAASQNVCVLQNISGIFIGIEKNTMNTCIWMNLYQLFVNFMEFSLLQGLDLLLFFDESLKNELWDLRVDTFPSFYPFFLRVTYPSYLIVCSGSKCVFGLEFL